MKSRICYFAVIWIAFLSNALVLRAAYFDWRGRISFSWEQEKIFDGEDYELLEAGSGKSLDTIDWRCMGSPSPLDQSLTLVGNGKKFSTKNSVLVVDNGFKATFDMTINEPSSDGNSIDVKIKIPHAIFSFIPENGVRTIASFDENGKAVVADTLYIYEFDLNGSETALEHGRIIDYRATDWSDDFRMELRTVPFSGNHARIVMTVTRTPNPALMEIGDDSPFMIIPLSDAFTRPLTDEIENDGLGGWTDQGTNDMSCLKPGMLLTQGVPFSIGDGAIILRGKARKSFDLESSVIPVNAAVERIAFCHTAAWCSAMVPGFYYRITYSDGSQLDVPVYGGQDVADWAGGLPSSSRVKCAWQGSNSEHGVSVAHFQWKNPSPEKPVESVQVISADIDTVPIVLAATAVRQEKAEDRLITFLNNEYAASVMTTPKLSREKPDWYEGGLDASAAIEPESALDVSFLLHKPAGKYGFVKKVGNHFEFENLPGKRISFWGTCVQAAGPRKEFAPVIADRLSKSGINIVRIHLWMSYFSHPLCKIESDRTFIRQDGSVNLDRLDDLYYFLAELKKHGIYVYMDTISSYNSSWLKGGDEPHYVKSANDRIKEIAKLVLTTVNPYTGLALVDDPSFAMCEIHNEFSATYQGTVETHSEEAQEVMQEMWTRWKKDHGIDNSEPLKGGPVEGNGEIGRKFYTDVQKHFLEDWYAFLRETGVKVPISGTNLLLTVGDLVASQNMDFTEDHAYYGSSPCATGGYWLPTESSTVKNPLRGNPMIGEILHSRLHDKPVVCTEWSHVYPNQYREEGYPFVSAFTAYQAIDGMFSFDWAGAYLDNISSLLDKGHIVCLSQICDPSTWGLNQAAAVAFLRGDITPSPNRIVFNYTQDDVWQNRRQKPLGVAYLFQMGQVSIKMPGDEDVKPSWPFETGMTTDELFQNAVERFGIDAGRDYITSDTKELTRFTEPGLLLVDTPCSQFATGALSSLGSTPRRRLSAFDVVSSMAFATITFTSLDDRPLTESGRILLCAVGNSANSTSYFDENGYHEADKAPILCEPFYASVSAQAVPGKSLKVYCLEPSTGKRMRQLPVTLADGKETFILDKETRTMYLELVRE